MRLLLSLIFICVLTPNINCFFEFLSVVNPSYLNENILEKGLFEPIVYENDFQDKNGNRYYEKDILKFDELNQNPIRDDASLVSSINEIDQLPNDNAYFYTQPQQQQEQLQQQQNDEYFDAPTNQNIFNRYSRNQLQSQDSQSDEQSNSQESFETIQSVIDNNPFESFLDSIVGSKPNDLEEQQIEKRVFVLPETTVDENEQPFEQIKSRRHPHTGLIDLISNRANRFNNGEYNSPEYGSNEEERDRILILEPLRTNVWAQEIQPEQNEDAVLSSGFGLFNLIKSKLNGYGDDSNTEYEREERAFFLTPSQSQYWDTTNEDLIPTQTEENRNVVVPIIDSNENNNEPLEKIKENLAQEQERYIDNLLDDQVQVKSHDLPQQHYNQQQEQQIIDQELMQSESLPQVQNNYVEIKLNKKIERHEAEDLLSFISHLTAIDSSLIKDINVDGNRVWFRLDGLDNQDDLDLFVQQILNHEQQIEQEKGLTIVSSNLISNPNIENIEKRKSAAPSKQDATAKKLFLITVTVCGSVLVILITLVAIFVIKRRAYLRNKLIDELNLPKKKKFDDVERLVESDLPEQSKFTKIISKLCSYKQKNERIETDSDVDAATPNKDTEKILSRQSHQDYQDLCRSEDFVPTHLMTTPVTTNTEMTRKTNVAESTRSSTSS